MPVQAGNILGVVSLILGAVTVILTVEYVRLVLRTERIGRFIGPVMARWCATTGRRSRARSTCWCPTGPCAANLTRLVHGAWLPL